LRKYKREIIVICLVMLHLIEIELGDLKKMGGEISHFLEEKLRTEVAMKGNKLIVSEGKNHPHPSGKEVKMEVNRVLHHLGLTDCRALKEHDRIRIVRVKQKPKPPAEKKGTPVPPSQSLPYFFP
jgi:hypothetical protein